MHCEDATTPDTLSCPQSTPEDANFLKHSRSECKENDGLLFLWCLSNTAIGPSLYWRTRSSSDSAGLTMSGRFSMSTVFLEVSVLGDQVFPVYLALKIETSIYRFEDLVSREREGKLRR